MNTNSDRLAKARLRPGLLRIVRNLLRPRTIRFLKRPGLYLSAAAAVLAACIQGPWDYYPKDPPYFQGVSVTGYALAGKPIEHVCFERLLGLDEEATQAFAFYDSADVRIQGRFAGVDKNLVLTAIVDTPNCFKGPPTDTVERGGSYALTADLTWDSGGTRVTSVIQGTANVPVFFKMHKDAKAPSLAFSGQVPDNIFNVAFVRRLPAQVIFDVLTAYPDLAQIADTSTTQKNLDTSKVFQAYILKNGKGITSLLLKLLGENLEPYKEGATLYYLNGGLNTLSHYYSSERSPDVQSVLITQQFDPDSSRPETAFDSPVGLKPTPDEYYFPGNHRRLLIYPDAKGSKGWNLLDSLGVVNVWFHTGRNRLFFYGMEHAYYSWLSTVTQVQGGGGGDVNPRIKGKYNVTGGHGVFVGGVPDSFDLYIKTDSLTKVYPLPEVHGASCNKDGWFHNKDCRDYYRSWCDGHDWDLAECTVDAIRASLEADFKDTVPNTVLKARVAAKADSISRDKLILFFGTNEFCVEQDFPAAGGACDQARTDCLESRGRNSCKDALWNFCLDNAWSPAQCKPGLASYCHDKPRLSEIMCKHADEWCADPAHAGSPLCK